MTIQVVLSWAEMDFASDAGCKRQISNVKSGRLDRFGASDDKGWQLHIEGCMGEYAVAKALGIFWNGNLGNLKAPDVGSLQVRTRSKHHWDLILHESDPDDDAFILVTGTNGKYTLQGWIFARDGKLSRYLKDPAGGREAFFVPQSALIDMAYLMRRGQRMEVAV